MSKTTILHVKQIIWYISLTSTARLWKQCLCKIVGAKQGELWVMWARHLTLTMPHSTQVYKWQTYNLALLNAHVVRNCSLYLVADCSSLWCLWDWTALVSRCFFLLENTCTNQCEHLVVKVCLIQKPAYRERWQCIYGAHLLKCGSKRIVVPSHNRLNSSAINSSTVM